MVKGGSTPEYEIIEAFDPDKYYSIHIPNRHRQILSAMTNVGEKFTPSQFCQSHSTLLNNDKRTKNSSQTVLSHSIKMGLQVKILKRHVSDSTVPNEFKNLESVSYWLPQLRGSRFKNVTKGLKGTNSHNNQPLLI